MARIVNISIPRLLFLMIPLLCALGCGQDGSLIDSPTVQPKIEFYLAPGASTQFNITKIELTVSAPDIDEPLLFPITNINREERTARDTIEVPVGSDRTFRVRAFEENCPVLSGLLENVEVTQNAPIIITLAPIQIVIGIRSEQDQLNVGDTYVLEVYVEDAPKLFAFTCELEFDETLLEPPKIIPGDFFGAKDDVLFLEDSQLPRRQENRLSLGITRKGAAAGVCGSGVVFRLTFGTIGKGDAAITLLRNNRLTLTTPAFEQIGDSRIRIEASAHVRIE